MQYKRVIILGCPGAGKSTFSLKLGEITGLPVIHLDGLFWKPGWVMAERDEFREALQNALALDEWIIDGNYSGTLPARLERCELAVYMDYPRVVCMWGIMSRVLKNLGRTRPDMGDGCPERFDWEFIKYTWNFDKNDGAKSKAYLRQSGKPVVWLRSRRKAREYLRSVPEAVREV